MGWIEYDGWEQMYEIYAFRPQDRPPELEHAIRVVRPFLHRQPNLHSAVREAVIATAVGHLAENPHTMVARVLRQDVDSGRLCSVLTSPWADAALEVLTFEFPLARLLFDLLPTAAQVICAERHRNNNVALGAGALVAGGLMILHYLSSKDKAA